MSASSVWQIMCIEINCLCFTAASLDAVPVKTTYEGNSVSFTCRSGQGATLRWQFCKFMDSMCQIVVENGALKENMMAKFRLDVSTSSFDKLTILEVNMDDNGFYLCSDGDDNSGNKQYTYLRVLRKCRPNTILHTFPTVL
jgi:hypothetical protein